MHRLQLAELRDSWSTWLGVSLGFITTNFALVLSALTLVAGSQAVRSGHLDPLDSTAFVITPAQNLAAEAASKQEMFWPWLDFVFTRRHALEREDLIGYAAELGLDVEAFIEDLDSDEVAARVQRDIASAEASGAKMTPTFFIEGCRMVGSYDARSLTEMLESSRRGSRTQAAKA